MPHTPLHRRATGSGPEAPLNLRGAQGQSLNSEVTATPGGYKAASGS